MQNAPYRPAGHSIEYTQRTHPRDTFLYTPCPEKKKKQFSLNNFNKYRHSFLIFGMKWNHPEDSLYSEYYHTDT